jgi:hypothetical protein
VTISIDYIAVPFISSSHLEICLLDFKSISDGKPVLFMLGIRIISIGPHLVEIKEHCTLVNFRNI